MNRTSAVMVENHKDEEELERNRRDDEEICRNQVLGVILEKGSPCLGGRPPLPDQVLGDRLCQRRGSLAPFARDPGRTGSLAFGEPEAGRLRLRWSGICRPCSIHW